MTFVVKTVAFITFLTSAMASSLAAIHVNLPASHAAKHPAHVSVPAVPAAAGVDEYPTPLNATLDSRQAAEDRAAAAAQAAAEAAAAAAAAQAAADAAAAQEAADAAAQAAQAPQYQAPASVYVQSVAPSPARQAPPPPPAIVIGSAQQSLINQDRAAGGLAPLNWSPCLASIAYAQAQAMASAGNIFHGNGVQRDWSCGLGSSQTGENVGVWGSGINDGGINGLFVASAPHYANIMGPYHYVGTAWVVSGGKGYIAVEFA